MIIILNISIQYYYTSMVSTNALLNTSTNLFYFFWATIIIHLIRKKDIQEILRTFQCIL